MSEDLKIPVHASIIMDGNGRWALERNGKRTDGHKAGIESVRSVIEGACELGIKYMSLYAFSEENWDRPEKEVRTLMALMAECMVNERKLMMDSEIKLVVLGNRDRLDDRLNESIDSLVKDTSGNDRLTLIVFLSYSGKWDILQAAKKMAFRVAEEALENGPESAESFLEDFSNDDFGKYLVTAGIPDPDFILRTAGEQRLSNYMLWQAAYSEFVYTDIKWPDFRKEDLVRAIEDFSARNRRYGKVK